MWCWWSPLSTVKLNSASLQYSASHPSDFTPLVTSWRSAPAPRGLEGVRCACRATPAGCLQCPRAVGCLLVWTSLFKAVKQSYDDAVCCYIIEQVFSWHGCLDHKRTAEPCNTGFNTFDQTLHGRATVVWANFVRPYTVRLHATKTPVGTGSNLFTVLMNALVLFFYWQQVPCDPFGQSHALINQHVESPHVATLQLCTKNCSFIPNVRSLSRTVFVWREGLQFFSVFHETSHKRTFSTIVSHSTEMFLVKLHQHFFDEISDPS